MFIEFILIWMLAWQQDMPTVFWVFYAVWVIYRIFKAMVDNAPEMED